MTTLVRKNQRIIQPLAFGVYFWTVAILALIGLADSVYLSISHYRIYTDVVYESFCAISQAINCDTVSQSPYAVFLRMPVPVWGMIGYIFFLLLLVITGTTSERKLRVWGILVLVSLIYSIYSIFLSIISLVYIKSYCIMCILVHAINFLLLYFCWLVRRRFDPKPVNVAIRTDLRFLWHRRKITTFVFASFFGGVLLVWSVFPSYWNLKPSIWATSQPTGMTSDGHPWIGAKNPKVVITEFTDYLCFQCSKMNYHMRKLMIRYPGQIRVIHRHFPMDHTVNPIVEKPVHTGAGSLALLAIYAETEGKFWLTNDYLFANARFNSRVDLRSMADEVGLDYVKLSRSINNKAFRRKLQNDIKEGLRIGVHGTPTYLIDGEVYRGQIPPHIISLLDEKA